MKLFSNRQITVSPEDHQFALRVKQDVDLAMQTLNQGNAELAVSMFHKILARLKPDFPGYDLITHNLLIACKQRIEQMLKTGDHAGTTPHYRTVLSLEIRGAMNQDREFRQNFAEAIHGIGNSYFSEGQFEPAAKCFRKAILVDACPSYHVNLSNALSAAGMVARLSDFGPWLEKDKLGHHMFITCMPKSGSTFLKNVLCDLTGYADHYFFFAHGQNEHDLYLPVMLKFAGDNTVSQQHSRASHANVQLMQAFEIKPVVLVRNIFDAMMSQLDFYNQGAAFNSYHRGDFEKLDEETKIDLLIQYVAPWYFQFLASWQKVEEEKKLEIMWLSYEELIADKPRTVENVLKFYGLKHKRAEIENTINSVEQDGRRNRFNRGVAGRGKTRLSQAHKDKIAELKRFYPSVDFSRIGV